MKRAYYVYRGALAPVAMLKLQDPCRHNAPGKPVGVQRDAFNAICVAPPDTLDTMKSRRRNGRRNVGAGESRAVRL